MKAFLAVIIGIAATIFVWLIFALIAAVIPILATIVAFCLITFVAYVCLTDGEKAPE